MDGAIPGAYPATPLGDLEPTPAPAAPVSAPVQPRQDHHHHHHHDHDHNKLHKPADPRGHKHTDSGVVFDSDPIRTAREHEKPRRQPEAPLPLSNFDPTAQNPVALPPAIPYAEPVEDRNVDFVKPIDKSETIDHRDNTTPPQKSANTDNTPPYWGSLPKSHRGGIYNTVTGHGSPTDDHDQHHHLPQRSGSKKAHVDGDTSDYPKGGVYNTVTGHGSHDEESQRHNGAPSSGLAAGGQRGSDAGALTGIVEEQDAQPSSEFAATETGRNDIARGFLPETATRDDAVLASSLGAIQKEPTVRAPVDADVSQSASEFPLKPSQKETVRGSSDAGSGDRDASIATAAAAGVGIAGMEEKNKRNKLKKREDPTTDAKNGYHSKDDAVHPAHHKDESRSGRRSSDEGSSGEKKHKLLGIFHRRKGSKSDKDQVHHEKPVETKEDRHHNHKKEAAAAAAGAGTYGVLHHKDAQKAKDRSASEPSAEKLDSHHAKRTSMNESSAATTGAYVMPAQGPGAETRHQMLHDSTHGSAPSPPERSSKRRSLTPPAPTAVTSEASTRSPSTQHSVSESAKYAGAGAAAGLGASVFAKNFDQSSKSSEPRARSSVTSPDSGVAPTTFENPREPPPTPANAVKGTRTPSPKAASPRTHAVVTDEPGNYNKLPSGTASGVKTSGRSSLDHKSASHSQEYSTLASGTASGMKSSLSSEQDEQASGDHDGPQSDSGLYNVLPSGTPSGVKVGSVSRPTRHSDLAETSRVGNGQDNKLATGTASGIDTEHAGQQDVSHTTRNVVAAPMPIHEKADKPVEKPASTAFPPPDMAKEMSPEVMPDSYREQSHPVDRSTHHAHTNRDYSPKTDVTEESRPQKSTMDPAVAAAAGAWAAKAGPSSGVPEQPKVTHMCEHCGRENDISSVFTKENISKMNKKHGSTGNWWQDAWTSS
ncbi:hypothetical protein QBC47DRAFT_388076 [Echria macrotheca]|uniref:Uncharacterized protein n=1 Tax=Echria macrotheca TaxID=438768 RepID=A0AAJ0F7D1_9PEZI|nr:hypothetical protein QBC47DRAFT_388076 [Echria macrotheca]